MLGFDLPTFIFQIINFVILLAILARFFYRPVLDVMRRRQEQIDARIEAAEEKARQADAERQELAGQAARAAEEAAALMERTRAEAGRERRRLLDAARGEAATLIDEARKTIAAEEEAALARLEHRLSESAATIAGSVIRNVAGPAVHESLLAGLLSNGFKLEDEALQAARSSGDGRPAAVRVESGYPLDEAQQQRLREAAAQILERPAETIELDLREEPALLAGVRVLVGGLVIDSSLKHMLAELGTAPDEGGAA